MSARLKSAGEPDLAGPAEPGGREGRPGRHGPADQQPVQRDLRLRVAESTCCRLKHRLMHRLIYASSCMPAHKVEPAARKFEERRSGKSTECTNQYSMERTGRI